MILDCIQNNFAQKLHLTLHKKILLQENCLNINAVNCFASDVELCKKR